MAETDITEAQLIVELGRVKTYIRSQNFVSARSELACAGITLVRLASSLGTAGKSISYQNEIEAAQKLIDSLEESVADDDTTRVGYVKTGFGG